MRREGGVGSQSQLAVPDSKPSPNCMERGRGRWLLLHSRKPAVSRGGAMYTLIRVSDCATAATCASGPGRPTHVFEALTQPRPAQQSLELWHVPLEAAQAGGLHGVERASGRVQGWCTAGGVVAVCVRLPSGSRWRVAHRSKQQSWRRSVTVQRLPPSS